MLLFYFFHYIIADTQPHLHPKIVQERLGHSSIVMTLDTYSHIAPGLQEAAAEKFDSMVNPKREDRAVEKDG